MPNNAFSNHVTSRARHMRAAECLGILAAVLEMQQRCVRVVRAQALWCVRMTDQPYVEVQALLAQCRVDDRPPTEEQVRWLLARADALPSVSRTSQRNRPSYLCLCSYRQCASKTLHYLTQEESFQCLLTILSCNQLSGKGAPSVCVR